MNSYRIKFYPYNSDEFLNLDPTIVSCKYFDLPFNPYEDLDDWYSIPTPKMQLVMDYQKFSEDVCRWMYVFIGRLCFDVNDLDGWQIIPFLKGIARSGKSTLITKVCRKFYETEDIATLSNNIEKKFGLSSIHTGFMFISPEVKGDLALDQAEFQSLVSGEDVSIARKHESALSKQWKTPGILGGNEVPNWKDNSGSIIRRLATWHFGKQVMQADTELDKKLEEEMPAILCKCLRAYLDYTHRFSGKDIWNILPKYFKDVQNEVANATNSLRHFLDSPGLRYSPELFIPQSQFNEIYLTHCKKNSFTSSRLNEDFYGGPFSSREITVVSDSRIYKDKVYNEPFFCGVDVNIE
jgi:phage/plasmid-associated DNA primase